MSLALLRSSRLIRSTGRVGSETRSRRITTEFAKRSWPGSSRRSSASIIGGWRWRSRPRARPIRRCWVSISWKAGSRSERPITSPGPPTRPPRPSPSTGPPACIAVHGTSSRPRAPGDDPVPAQFPDGRRPRQRRPRCRGSRGVPCGGARRSGRRRDRAPAPGRHAVPDQRSHRRRAGRAADRPRGDRNVVARHAASGLVLPARRSGLASGSAASATGSAIPARSPRPT